MDEVLKKQYLGAIAILFNLIFSVSVYAYFSDKEVSKKEIQDEIVERKEADKELKKADEQLKEEFTNELEKKVDKTAFDIFLTRWETIEKYIMEK